MNWLRGPMARRLTTNQEIPGSTPGVIIFARLLQSYPSHLLLLPWSSVGIQPVAVDSKFLDRISFFCRIVGRLGCFIFVSGCPCQCCCSVIKFPVILD
jgi:hypothetical protein